MTGSLLNAGAIVLGGIIGLLLGAQLPEKIRQSVLLALGIFTLLFGIQLFLETENALIPLLSLLTGSVIGEFIDLEGLLNKASVKFEAKVSAILERGDSVSTRKGLLLRDRFVQGFVSTSLIYCSGPMAFLGAVQNGLTGDISTLTVKSILDGFASLAFASSLGLGVVFSSIPVLVYQGSVSIFAAQIERVMTTAMINELTSVGGIILVSLAISSFLEIKPIRTINFLPALIIAPIFTWLSQYI